MTGVKTKFVLRFFSNQKKGISVISLFPFHFESSSLFFILLKTPSCHQNPKNFSFEHLTYTRNNYQCQITFEFIQFPSNAFKRPRYQSFTCNLNDLNESGDMSHKSRKLSRCSRKEISLPLFRRSAASLQEFRSGALRKPDKFE